MMARVIALLAVTAAGTLAAPAAAQDYAGFDESQPPVIDSPENFAFEFRVGPYRPSNDAVDAGLDDISAGRNGPFIGGELDYVPWRIPYIGLVGFGAGIGWVRYKGHALDAAGQETDEDAKLILYPLSALAVLRIDVLARELDIPLLFAVKIGADFIRWRSRAGGREEADGTSIGLHWAAQVALELDFLEPQAARNLDEEWGINHSFIFFEMYGINTGTSLEVGDSFTFAAGLGLIF
jgi:hypothetical protein